MTGNHQIATRFFLLIIVCGMSLAQFPVGAQEGKSYPDGQGGKVFFPLGDLSFVDEIVRFESGQPAASKEIDREPSHAVGVPDYHKSEEATYTTLGCGGTLVARFVDNVLVDLEGPDLYVFEIGPAVEPTHLAISRDGESWTEVGRISGGRADVDIQKFIDGPEPYTHVRLVDGRSDCGGDWPGADIDAIGAIGSAFLIQLDASVLFDFNEATLRPEAREELQKVLDVVADYPGAGLVIEGHTDSIGTDAFNRDLSLRRAESVRAFLVESGGLAAADLGARGHGESRPVATNDTDEGRQRNRRVEITVTPASGTPASGAKPGQ